MPPIFPRSCSPALYVCGSLLKSARHAGNPFSQPRNVAPLEAHRSLLLQPKAGRESPRAGSSAKVCDMIDVRDIGIERRPRKYSGRRWCWRCSGVVGWMNSGRRPVLSRRFHALHRRHYPIGPCPARSSSARRIRVPVSSRNRVLLRNSTGLCPQMRELFSARSVPLTYIAGQPRQRALGHPPLSPQPLAALLALSGYPAPDTVFLQRRLHFSAS
jgi:hypothetical protein